MLGSTPPPPTRQVGHPPRTPPPPPPGTAAGGGFGQIGFRAPPPPRRAIPFPPRPQCPFTPSPECRGAAQGPCCAPSSACLPEWVSVRPSVFAGHASHTHGALPQRSRVGPHAAPAPHCTCDRLSTGLCPANTATVDCDATSISCIGMADNRRRCPPPPQTNPPPNQTATNQRDHRGKKRNLQSGKSCRAIFGTNFWAPDPAPPLPPSQGCIRREGAPEAARGGVGGRLQRCIGRRGGKPPPPSLQGAQSMPSHCFPNCKCQAQWHL